MPSDIHIGSGSMIALYDPPGVQLSIRNLINLMMRISDNSAADILFNKVGAANVTARMKSLGLNSIRVDRSTLEMILDQSGLDYAQFGALPARQVRKLLDSIDAHARRLGPRGPLQMADHRQPALMCFIDRSGHERRRHRRVDLDDVDAVDGLPADLVAHVRLVVHRREARRREVRVVEDAAGREEARRD